MAEKAPRLSRRQVANTGEFLRWLIEETWHAGHMHRRHEERKSSDPAAKVIAALDAGRFYGMAQCLSHYTDRDIDKIHNAESLEALFDLVKDGASWWDAIERQTRKALKEQEEA